MSSLKPLIAGSHAAQKSTQGGGSYTDDRDPIDMRVGDRIRLRRTLLGMSQSEVAHAIGVSYQQVQKYELGATRLSVSRLVSLSRVLRAPVGSFFDDIEDVAIPTNMSTETGNIPIPREPSGDHPFPMSRRETLELVRAYHHIPDRQMRRCIFEMAKAAANALNAAAGH